MVVGATHTPIASRPRTGMEDHAGRRQRWASVCGWLNGYTTAESRRKVVRCVRVTSGASSVLMYCPLWERKRIVKCPCRVPHEA